MKRYQIVMPDRMWREIKKASDAGDRSAAQLIRSAIDILLGIRAGRYKLIRTSDGVEIQPN